MMEHVGTVDGTSRVHLWGRWEGRFESAGVVDDPVHTVDLRVELTAPSGRQRTVRAFWDGGQTWRARACLDEVGTWSYAAHSEQAIAGLDGETGSIACVQYTGDNPLYRHGAVGLSPIAPQPGP